MNPEQVAGEISSIKASIKSAHKRLDALTKANEKVINLFVDGKFKLEKNCLLSKGNGDMPVRQRELARIYKLLFWLMGIVFSGGGGIAIWQFVK